jgi:2-polyprenyl-3-methyl-5-hydroxy-6-metoxy-1,4-benzoquinol methylase
MPETQNEWITFFDHHAPYYLQEVFTRNTDREIDFIVEELALPPGCRILDVGCGVGRHAIPLASRGYHVTGIDISEGMLAEARKRAAQAALDVEWVHADASRFSVERRFDAAICLCEGAFGLLGSGDDPHQHELAILRCIRAAIRPGARLILTALNGLAKIRKASQEDIQAGRFDHMSLVETFTLDYEAADGRRTITLRERGFVPSELRLMLEVTGFQVEHVYGGTAGDWNRGPVKLDEIELMAIARRSDDDD